MNSIFEERYTERYKMMNDNQKLAIETIDGPVMVIAGPGTGKTSVLTLRIARILKTDIPPSAILAITFTDSGVKEMKKKLRDIIGGRADDVKIYTFHGLAASIMSEFRDHFVETDEFIQMTDIETEELMRGIIESEEFSSLRPLGKPDLYIYPIISGISEAKREGDSPNRIKEFCNEEIERIKNDETFISTRGASKGEFKAEAKKQIEKLQKTITFADVYARYEEKKKELKFLDYDDLILNVVKAFGKDKLLLQLIQEKFLYLLVDEHQDTNDSQNLMIRYIVDFFEKPNIFIVGDEKQAIMRFQGASLENFNKLRNTWPDMKVIPLKENYRSHQDILDASFSMIERNYEGDELKDLRIKLSACVDKNKKPIDIVHTKDRHVAEMCIIEELKRIQKDEPNKTVVLISRTNKDVDRIIQRAEESGVKISAERSIDIFSHPIGNIFFSLVEVILDPLNTEALGKTLVVPNLWNKDFAESVELLKLLRKGEIGNVLKKIPELGSLRTFLTEDSPMLFIINLAKLSGFMTMTIIDPTYVEVWRGILNLSEKIVKQYNITDPLELLKKLTAYKTTSRGKRIKVSVGTSDANIFAMTAHGSKGLEFDYVYVPYATEEAWLPKKRSSFFILPSKKLEKEGDDIRDARRLFYVALTRAKEHAVIMIPGEDVAGDLTTPLRFVSELESDSVKVTTLEREWEMPTYASRAKSQKIIDYAKSTLQEKGLSVTALNHFIECSAQFLFKSILKLPDAPSATAEKGIAMHTALNRIWQKEESERTEEEIERTIELTARESVGSSHLRKFEKDVVIKELVKLAPVVATCLLPHFHTQGEISTESWSEREYIGTYEGNNVSLRLHGKLDTIIETPDDMLVFDYKTKKKMSVNEIKGMTANSDGGYFRQLVFYKMLLDEQARKKGKNIVPSLVFLTPDEKGRCETQTLEIEKKDIEEVESHINELIRSVWSGDMVLGACDEEKCEWCSMLRLINKSN